MLAGRDEVFAGEIEGLRDRVACPPPTQHPPHGEQWSLRHGYYGNGTRAGQRSGPAAERRLAARNLAHTMTEPSAGGPGWNLWS